MRYHRYFSELGARALSWAPKCDPDHSLRTAWRVERQVDQTSVTKWSKHICTGSLSMSEKQARKCPSFNMFNRLPISDPLDFLLVRTLGRALWSERFQTSDRLDSLQRRSMRPALQRWTHPIKFRGSGQWPFGPRSKQFNFIQSWITPDFTALEIWKKHQMLH